MKDKINELDETFSRRYFAEPKEEGYETGDVDVISHLHHRDAALLEEVAENIRGTKCDGMGKDTSLFRDGFKWGIREAVKIIELMKEA